MAPQPPIFTVFYIDCGYESRLPTPAPPPRRHFTTFWRSVSRRICDKETDELIRSARANSAKSCVNYQWFWFCWSIDFWFCWSIEWFCWSIDHDKHWCSADMLTYSNLTTCFVNKTCDFYRDYQYFSTSIPHQFFLTSISARKHDILSGKRILWS